MKNRLIIGIVITLLGLLLAVGTQTIFPVCEAGDMVMKCFWTGRAASGIGGVITVIGILLLIFNNKRTRIGLLLALVPTGIYAVLIPNLLIGVCGGAHMNCRALALPAITIIGVAVIIFAIASAIWLFKSDKGRDANGA
ncbi:MAG: DUF4418 family protein [Ruminococcus sp.]|jgi:hypothetical protein|nr:DUF4418 family protein [Ruminococcus sp.]